MPEVVIHDDERWERVLKRKGKMSAARRKRRRPRAA